MKKNLIGGKKLQFKKETLVDLTTEQLGNVRGGHWTSMDQNCGGTGSCCHVAQTIFVC